MESDLSAIITNCQKSSEKLLRSLKKSTDKQVRAAPEKRSLKDLSDQWFNMTRPELLHSVDSAYLQKIDEIYEDILSKSTKNPQRETTIRILKDLSKELSSLLGNRILYEEQSQIKIPDFKTIARDPKIVILLENRWNEISVCIKYGAPLAAIVMIGGLIEALLIAKINGSSDKSLVFTATKAPKDEKGKTKALKHWTLYNMLEVSHELKWLSDSYLDISMLFRDYRNYIHPYKELSENKSFQENDIDLVWKVTYEIINQILK